MAKVRVDRPFVGIPSFLRAPICTDLEQLQAAVAVMGVPFDEGVPYLPGSRMAPRALREHSLRFVGSGSKGFYNPETGKQYLEYEMSRGLIVDAGDADILPTNVEGTFENVTQMVRQILDRGAMPLVLGGDHSITYPVVRAFGTPLHVVHFDAHSDYAPFIHDLRFTNQHPFRHIRPMKHVLSLTQVGIRSLRESAEMFGAAQHDNRVVMMAEFRRLTPRGLAELVPADAPCYVSIDVDVLDISLVPGCVSAEPNGMSYAELRDTLREIAQRADVIGFDFVEVNPQLDVGTGLTSYLGVHTVLEFLGHICEQPRWVARRERRQTRERPQRR